MDYRAEPPSPPSLACSPGSHHMLLARAETRRESARCPGSPEPAQSRPGERGRRGRRVTRLTDSPSQPKSPLQSHEPPADSSFSPHSHFAGDSTSRGRF